MPKTSAYYAIIKVTMSEAQFWTSKVVLIWYLKLQKSFLKYLFLSCFNKKPKLYIKVLGLGLRQAQHRFCRSMSLSKLSKEVVVMDFDKLSLTNQTLFYIAFFWIKMIPTNDVFYN